MSLRITCDTIARTINDFTKKPHHKTAVKMKQTTYNWYNTQNKNYLFIIIIADYWD